MQHEDDPRIKRIWELHLAMELEHLRLAGEMMKTYDRREPEMIVPKALPEPVRFESNKAYVRSVLANQVDLTMDELEFVPMADLPKNHRFFQHQEKANAGGIPSEEIIAEHKRAKGSDYRFQSEGEHPVPELEKEEA
jgi:hypothetical protein